MTVNPLAGTANGECGMEDCCLLSKQIIEKILPRPPRNAQRTERAFLPLFPLLSHLTHLTRSVPNNERRRRQLYQFPSSKKAHSSLQRIFLPKRLRETRASVAKRSTVAVFTQPLREKYFFLSTLDSLSGLLLARRSNFATSCGGRPQICRRSGNCCPNSNDSKMVPSLDFMHS